MTYPFNGKERKDGSKWDDVVYMRPPAAALYTGLSESTLAKQRMLSEAKSGPKFLKISGCVVYRRADLDEWMNEHAVQ